MRKLSILERVVRVEELKALKLKLEKRFESMERANQQRPEAIERRPSFLQRFMGIGFTFPALLITLLNLSR